MDAVKAPIALASGVTSRAAFEQIMAACLRHAHVSAGAIAIETPDGVHQTRVGLRRARSLLSLFQPYLNKKQRKTVDREFRRLGRQLGPCRDWDVFLSETLPRLAKHQDESITAQLEAAAKAKQIAAYQNVTFNLADMSPAIEVKAGEVAIGEIADDLLDSQYYRVRTCYRHVGTPEDRHTLRKTMKKLRYSVEFLSSLYSNESKAMRAFLGHCKDLQDVLGKMNDALATIDLLDSLELHPDVVMSALRWARHHDERAHQHLATEIERFRAAKPFWD